MHAVASRHGLPFPWLTVKAQLEEALGGRDTPGRKCLILNRGDGERPLLYIATSTAAVKDVLTVLYPTALEYGLSVYDGHTCRILKLYDEPYVKMRRCVKAANIALCREFSVKKVVHMSDKYEPLNNSAECLVSLKRQQGMTKEQLTQHFHDVLLGVLVQGENLVCRDQCFFIEGDGYRVAFCLEGYMRSPGWCGHFDHGRPEVDVLRRMSCDVIAHWKRKQWPSRNEEVARRMHLREMEWLYPNPADRYAASIRITKQLMKHRFDIRYEPHDGPVNGVQMHALPGGGAGCADGKISRLLLGNEAASLLLPAVLEVYPCYRKRSGGQPNHLPREMWEDVMEAVRKIRRLMLCDPFGDELKPCLSEMDTLQGSGEERAQELFNMRSEAAWLYDAFLRWSELQLKCYGEELMINIQGPRQD